MPLLKLIGRQGVERSINALAEDSAGNLIFATEEHGLTVVRLPLQGAAKTTNSSEHPSRIKTPEWLLDDSPLAVAVDGRNRIWLGNRTTGE